MTLPTRRPWIDRADWEAVRPGQSGWDFRAELVVHEEWLAQRGVARRFHLERACRYVPATQRWTPLPPPEGDAEIAFPGVEGVQRPAYRFPAERALYFAEWTEFEGEVAGPRHRVAIASGTDGCSDTTDVKGAGEILACVPQSTVNTLSVGMPVPDPADHCAGG